MAATGKTPILLYGSTTPTNAPAAGNLTNSSDGCEIAINVADKNLFFKDSTNVVNTVPIRQSSASSNGWLSSTDWTTFNNKAPSFTYTSGYIPYGQGTTTPTQSSALTYDGSVLNSVYNGSGVKVFAGGDSSGTNGGFVASYGTSNTTKRVQAWVNGYQGQIDVYDSDNVKVIQLSGRGNSYINGGGLSIGNTTDPGAGNLSVTGKVSVPSTFESTSYVNINASTPTTIASGISFLAVVRCRGSGGSAVILYENNYTPVIVSQVGPVSFTTSAPGALEIQIADGGSSITALSGSSVGVNALNITIIKNQ